MKLCTFGQQSQIHQLMELIASASEVTTVWHYRNFIVIIIIIKINTLGIKDPEGF